MKSAACADLADAIEAAAGVEAPRAPSRGKRVSLDRIPLLLERVAGVMSSEIARIALKASGDRAQSKSEAARARLSGNDSAAITRYAGVLTGMYRGHREEERWLVEQMREKTLAELQAMIKTEGKSGPKEGREA